MTDFYLAYHGSSQKYADNIATMLERSNYEIKHIPILGEAGPYLSELLAPLKKPIIILISDNLLKSTICMYDGLNVLKSLIKDELIYPIVVKGIYGDESGVKKVDTNFSKVSDVINYMNYWRDIFLDARKSKRTFLNGGDSEHQAEKLQELRSISSETGEYLRLLRDIEHIRYEDIQKSDPELFFSFLSKQSYTEVNLEKDNIDQIPDVEAVKGTSGSETVSLGISPTDTVKQIIDHKLQQASGPQLTKEDGFVEVENLELDLSNGFEGEMISDKPLTEIVKPAITAGNEAAIGSGIPKQEKEEDPFDHTDQIIRDANAIFAEKQYDAGFIFLEDYLKYNPSNIDVRMHLANMRYDYGDKSQAALEVQNILELEPDQIQAHKWIAQHFEINENYDAALHHFLTVQRLDPNSPEIDYKIGLILKNHKNDPKSARQYFEESLKKNPDHKKTQFQLGLMTKAEGNYDKSEDFLRKSLDQSDKQPESNLELAKFFNRSGDFKKAKTHYLRAQAEDADIYDAEIEKFISKSKNRRKQKKKWEAIKEAIQPNLNHTNIQEEEIEKTTTSKPKTKKERKKKVEVKTILITGATSGIGLATAKELAKRGHRLILTGRRNERLSKIKGKIKTTFGTKVQVLHFDVRDYNDARAAIKSLPKKWQRIDVLINNAGLALGKDLIHKADLKDWDTMLDTNIKGLLHMTRLVAPQMAKRKSGHIINVCSTAGHEVYPGGSVYCASKHAVDALTKGMRLDLHHYNIRVGQVSPGAVEETEFARVRFHGDKKKARIYKKFTPTNSKDIARIIRFMITRPKWVNIQDVLVMGTQQASNIFFDLSGRID